MPVSANPGAGMHCKTSYRGIKNQETASLSPISDPHLVFVFLGKGKGSIEAVGGRVESQPSTWRILVILVNRNIGLFTEERDAATP